MRAAKLVTIIVPFLAPGLCNTASYFISVDGCEMKEP